MRKYLFIPLFLILFSCQEEELDLEHINETKNDSNVEMAINFINKTFNNDKTKNGGNDFSSSNISSVKEIKNSKGEISLKIISFIPKGYMLLHTLDNLTLPNVLFYSDNKYDEKAYNPILDDMISNFIDKETEFIKTTQSGNTKSTKGQTDPVSFENIISDNVNPLMDNFKWHQWRPYNIFLDGSSQSGNPIGCVAIALGQIIGYHQHFVDPMQSFDWSKIVSQTSAVNDQYFEINNLLKHIAANVVINMTPGGTSSSLDTADDFMVEIGYDTFVTSGLDFLKGKLELQNNKPFYLQGIDKLGNGDKGHAFVCDGYKVVDTYTLRNGVKEMTPAYTTNYLHINWGWKEDSFLKGEDGWSFAEGLNIMTKSGIHFYNVENDMLLLNPVK